MAPQFNFLFPVLGYLIGSFPTGVIISKKKYLIDIREMGSGNIGATNVTRVFGWSAGFWTLILDTLKAFLPLYFMKTFLGTSPIFYLTAFSLVLGHCFSFYLKFKGGKGVASSLGVVLAIHPLMGFTLIAVYILAVALFKISAVGSLFALFTSLVWILIFNYPFYEKLLFLALALLILIRHQTNIKRLIAEIKEKFS